MNEETRFRDQVRCTLIFLSLQYVHARVIPVVELLLCLLALRVGEGTLAALRLSARVDAGLMLLEVALGEICSPVCSAGDRRGMWSSFFASGLPDEVDNRPWLCSWEVTRRESL